MPDIDTVRALLAAAGLPASEAEIEAHAAAYPELREKIAALYAAGDMRDLSPALRFRADTAGSEVDRAG